MTDGDLQQIRQAVREEMQGVLSKELASIRTQIQILAETLKELLDAMQSPMAKDSKAHMVRRLEHAGVTLD